MTGRQDKSLWGKYYDRLPVGAKPDDRMVGENDAGIPIYQALNGAQYSFMFPHEDRANRDEVSGWDVVAGIPSALAQQFWSAVSAPGRALRGEAVTNGDMWNTAGLASLSAIPGATKVAQIPENLASKWKNLYDLPTGSEVGNALGRSHSGGLDLEGRPLVARHVVGRTPGRTNEQSLSAEAVADLIQEKTRDGLTVEPRRQLHNGASGQVKLSAVNRTPLGVQIASDLTPRQMTTATAHEAGHVIDEISGQIPVKGLSSEVEDLYHFGVEGKFRDRQRTLPNKGGGYSGDEVPREYMAEAVRQYMAAPDTMKSRYPKTAATIRKHVNENPRLMDFIQFNSVTGLGLGLPWVAKEDRAADPIRMGF